MSGDAVVAESSAEPGDLRSPGSVRLAKFASSPGAGPSCPGMVVVATNRIERGRDSPTRGKGTSHVCSWFSGHGRRLLLSLAAIQLTGRQCGCLRTLTPKPAL